MKKINFSEIAENMKKTIEDMQSDIERTAQEKQELETKLEEINGQILLFQTMLAKAEQEKQEVENKLNELNKGFNKLTSFINPTPVEQPKEKATVKKPPRRKGKGLF